MESRRKKTISNIVMFAIILVLAVFTIVFTQSIKNQSQEKNKTSYTQENDSNGDAKEKESVQEITENRCEISIYCNTILDNLDDLREGKEAYVPSDGCVLQPISVDLIEGDTAFTVLKRVCEQQGIQLEFAYTPLYKSYYIEGIHQLYEFDCGAQSGWLYKVNGIFPNYGCSSYEVENGDEIVWMYTCNGLGNDVKDGE